MWVLVSIFPLLVNGIFLVAQIASRLSFVSFALSLKQSLRGTIPDTTTLFFFDLIDEARLASYFTCSFFRLLLPPQIIRATVDYYRIRFEPYSRNYIALHAFRFSTRYWLYKNVTLIIRVSWPIFLVIESPTIAIVIFCWNFWSFLVLSLLKLLFFRRLFLSVLMLLVFLLLLVRMECFLIFAVSAFVMYLLVEYLHFYWLSIYYSFLCWHLQEFENDLEILVSRFLFRMSFVFFFCSIWFQIPHVIVDVYQYSLLGL